MEQVGVVGLGLMGASLCKALKAAGYRCEVDTSAEKLGAKIRGGTMMKVPYMVIVGGKDEAAGVVSVRSRAEGDKGQMKLEDFIALLDAEKAE